MSSSPFTFKSPEVQALGVFLLLIVAVLALIVVHDFTVLELKWGSLILAILSCALLTWAVYKSAQKESESHIEYKFITDITPVSQEFYSKLYENSPIPYLVLDHKGEVVSANVSSARLLGITKDKLRGLNIFSKMESEAGHVDMLKSKYQGGISIGDETVRLKRANGSASWVLLSLYQFKTRAGEHMGLLTLVDITKQKRVEEAKSDFVSLASHQLRTPIAGMKWSAELLQVDGREVLNKRQQKYLDRLLIGADRLGLLVDDFLRVARFELGTFQPEFKAVSVKDIIEGVMTEQEQRQKQKQITVKTFFDLSLDDIYTDPHLLRMIVTNLYSNALKYTRQKGMIHIGFNRKNDELHIAVADNGMGIPATEQSHIFTKLFRATNAAKSEPDGTGLGLYIVKEAVEVLDGKVVFTSTENVSTTFEVVLPIIKSISADSR